MVFQLIERHYQKLQDLLGKKTVTNEYNLELTADEKLQAQELFQSRLDYWFETHFASRGLIKPALILRQMTSRWGSYSRKTHRVCLNYSLFRYPLELIDYVVVHELCHLVHHNHGKGFYLLLSSFLPNWHDLKCQLNSKNL